MAVLISAGGTAPEDLEPSDEMLDELPQQDDALFDDLIVGNHEHSEEDEEPVLCQPCSGNDSETLLDHSPKGLPAPPEFTPAQWAKHCLTHLPYHAGCPFCVMGKRPNTHHRRSKTVRRLPHLCADYGCLRDSRTEDVIPVVVLRVKPLNVFFACAVDLKGPEPLMARRLACVP